MKYETIKLDTAFLGYQEARFKEFLQNGWRIADKTVVGERYIYYVLAKQFEPDLGKTSDSQ